jgi:DNA-binding MarR family transcriptional regulator
MPVNPRVTKIQKWVLTELVTHGGRLIVSSGHRTTQMARLKDTHEPAIKINMMVLNPLWQRGFVTTEPREEGGRWMVITPLGEEMVRKKI